MMDYRKIFLLLSIFLLSACQPGTSPTVEGTAITTTYTQTPSPTRTQSPTYTPTPLPTLSEDEKLALSKELLTTNAGCRLPCWWGFTPGKTKWEDARRFLETVAYNIHPIEREDDVLIEVFFLVLEEFNPSAGEYPGPGHLRNIYYVKDGIIEAIEVNVGLGHTYDLPKLLNEYGQPDEVYIYSYPEQFQGTLPFGIFVFYKDQGIYAHFAGRGTEMGDYIQGCFMNSSVGGMMLWPPERGWSILEVSKKMHENRIDIFYNLPYLLEEVTDMDEEIFYQKYKGTTEAICITVPREPFYFYDERPTTTPGPCVFPGEPFY